MQWCGNDRINFTEKLCDVIGTHSARRTFVVHALEEGMAPQIVMTFTGHENYDSLRPYIAHAPQPLGTTRGHHLSRRRTSRTHPGSNPGKPGWKQFEQSD